MLSLFIKFIFQVYFPSIYLHYTWRRRRLEFITSKAVRVEFTPSTLNLSNSLTLKLNNLLRRLFGLFGFLSTSSRRTAALAICRRSLLGLLLRRGVVLENALSAFGLPL